MKLDLITSKTIKKVPLKELTNLHYRTHQLYTVAKKHDNKVLLKLLRQKHAVIVEEMKRRGMKHNSPLGSNVSEAIKVRPGTKTTFVVHDHLALRAGKHQDLRIRVASDKWDSFAVPKGVPLKPGTKVLAIKTHAHSDKEALFVGKIPKGEYGGGTLKVFDEGSCIVEKYSPAHIAVSLQGKKLKGLYHLINTGVARGGQYKQQHYMLFKGKIS